MNILTKTFVVLTTILAVLLVPLMIAYVINTNQYKQDLEDTQRQLAMANERANLVESALANSQTSQSIREQELDKTVEQLQGQLNQRLSEISALESRVVQRENDLALVRNDLSVEVSKGRQLAAFAEKINEEVKTLRDRVVEVNSDLAARDADLREKTADLESMNEQVRLLSEQLADANEQLADALRQRDAGVVTTAAAPTPAPLAVPVRGIVTEVQTVGEDTLVAINLGSNDKVAEGMNFIIHDKDQFVASMVVIKTDLNTSAGRVTLASGPVTRNLQVQSSDN